MDWIKVKTNHVLYEYNDLKDSEFQAWIKIMALTAQLEHEPTRKQILKHVNYQTLDSLSRKLHDHSIDLSSILHKVLIDVAYVAHRREALKINTQRYREQKKGVIDDVMMTSSLREDKIREDKNKKKEHIEFLVPEWIKKETWDAFIEMRKAIGAKPTIRAQELLVSKLDTMRLTGQDPNRILEQSTMNNWKGVFPIKDQTGGHNVGIRTARSDPRDKNLQTREDAEISAITARWEAAKAAEKSARGDTTGNAGNDDAPNFEG